MKKHLFWIAFTGMVVLFWLCSCTKSPTSQTSTVHPTATATQTTLEAFTLPGLDGSLTCKDAAVYYTRGDAALANQAYQAILTGTPLAKCAVEGMATLAVMIATPAPTATPTPTATPNVATIVPALLSVGDYSGAYDKVKEGIKADPNSIQGVNQDLLNWYILNNVWTTFILPILIVVLILIILFFAYRKIRRIYQTVQLDLKDFSSGTFFIDEKNMGALGKSIAARIEIYLKNCFDAQPNSVRGLVNTPMCLPELPANIPSQISGVWNFVMKLFPPRVLTVEGLLEYNEVQGIGLSIKIINEREQAFAGNQIFWAKDYDIQFKKNSTTEDKKIVKSESTTETSETGTNSSTKAVKNSLETTTTSQKKDEILSNKYFILADIAALWIYWKYCEYQQFDLQRIFGTVIFESYLWYSLACTQADSEQYLNNALLHDYRNTLALINKARISLSKFRLNYRSSSSVGIDVDAVKILQQVAGMRKHCIDASKILANYSLGVMYLDKSIQLVNAEESIGKLHILPDIESYDQYFKVAFDDINQLPELMKTKKLQFKPLSDHFIQAVQLPHIGFMIWQEPENDDWYELFKAIETHPNKTDDILYNLACAYSRFSLAKKNRIIEKLIDEFKFEEHYPYQPMEELRTETKIPTRNQKALQIALLYFEEACKSDPTITREFSKNESYDDNFKFIRYIFPAKFRKITKIK